MRITTTLLLTISSALMLAPASHAQVHDGDVVVGLSEGRLATGIPGDGGPDLGERVFATEFSSFLPNWTDMPGFDSYVGTFGIGDEIGIDIEAALRVWNGDDFETIPLEHLQIAKSGNVVVTPDIDTHTPGFIFGGVNNQGKLHEHVGYELLAPSGDGLYLLTVSLWSPEPDIDPSLPFWIIFDKDIDDPVELDEAVQWVRDNLVDPGVPGDLDGDGDVDLSDLGILLASFEIDGGGDLDGDGDTDLSDLGILLANFDT
jgi:hypothetical protein